MKLDLYKKIRFISNNIPIELYKTITKRKTILPFYHSITNFPKPHIKNIGFYRTKDDFIKDIAYFKKNFSSIAIKDINHKSRKPVFHLSFDDGLSEIYEEVVPILLENKIHATIFLNSDFVDNKNLFYRHKVGIILEEIKSISTTTSKSIINYLNKPSSSLKESISNLTFFDVNKIDEIAKIINVDFNEYLRKEKPYLTSPQIQEMIDLGFTFGNHGRNHFNFKYLSLKEQKKQLDDVNAILKNKFKIKQLYFSFPFGDEKITNDFFDYMYKEENVKYSFGISGLKKDEYKQHLHRISMENHDLKAENIIKYEYFYYLIRVILNKNKTKRHNFENKNLISTL